MQIMSNPVIRSGENVSISYLFYFMRIFNPDATETELCSLPAPCPYHRSLTHEILFFIIAGTCHSWNQHVTFIYSLKYATELRDFYSFVFCYTFSASVAVTGATVCDVPEPT